MESFFTPEVCYGIAIASGALGVIVLMLEKVNPLRVPLAVLALIAGLFTIFGPTSKVLGLSEEINWWRVFAVVGGLNGGIIVLLTIIKPRK